MDWTILSRTNACNHNTVTNVDKFLMLVVPCLIGDLAGVLITHMGTSVPITTIETIHNLLRPLQVRIWTFCPSRYESTLEDPLEDPFEDVQTRTYCLSEHPGPGRPPELWELPLLDFSSLELECPFTSRHTICFHNFVEVANMPSWIIDWHGTRFFLTTSDTSS